MSIKHDCKDCPVHLPGGINKVVTKTEPTWLYGSHRGLGWGAIEIDDDFTTLDFEPEWECKSDVKYYWKNRKRILALKNMTLKKYVTNLYKGLKLYRGLMNY